MTAVENLSQFLAQQYDKGLALWLEQGQLRFKGPKSVLSADVIQVLKQHKPAIIALLEQQTTEAETPDTPVVETEYPLSMSQSAIWMLYRFAPDSPVYNTTFCARLGSGADVATMEAAYQHILRRHPMLRSRFLDTPEGPRQQVMGHTDNQITRVDAAGWSEEKVEQWLADEAKKPFDLSVANPLRTRCLATDRGNILIATIHHIAADLWSLLVIAGDLLRDYGYYQQHGYFEVCPPRVCYQDYVQWQQEYMQSQQAIDAKAFWKQYLAQAILQPPMPTDYPRPAIMAMSTARVSAVLGSDQTRKIKAFCKTQGITPYVLFSSAFQCVLYYFIQRADFLIGTPTMGRSQQRMESVVGDFANPVPLRVKMHLQDTIGEWLSKNQHDLFGVLALQDFPFPALVDLMNPPRDASRTPLFQHMFVWHQGNKNAFMQQGVIEDILPLSGPCGSPYDVLLSVSDLGDGFECHWTYQDRLYDDATVQQFSTLLVETVQHVLTLGPQQPLTQLMQSVDTDWHSPRRAKQREPVTIDQVHMGHRRLSFALTENDIATRYYLGTCQNTDESTRENAMDIDLPALVTGNVIAVRNGRQEVLPVVGHYCANGTINIVRCDSGYGVFQGKLVNLLPIVQRRLRAREAALPHPGLYAVLCHLRENGEWLNVLYLEAVNDEVVHDIAQHCVECDDVVGVPRIEYLADGTLDIPWLLSIPVFDQRKKNTRSFADTSGDRSVDFAVPSCDIALLRVANHGVSQQRYPEKIAPAQESVDTADTPPEEGAVHGIQDAPALLSGRPLSQPIPHDNIVSGLWETARVYPDHGMTFIHTDGTRRVYSYEALLQQAQRMAGGLQQQGIGCGDVVILQVSEADAFFPVWWALVWLGAMPLTIAVPSHYSDTDPVAKKVKQVVDTIGPCVLLTDEKANDSQASPVCRFVSCSVLNLHDVSPRADAAIAAESLDYCRDNPVAFLQLTSGSTGVPKVIQMAHQGILHQVYAAAEHNGMVPTDRTLNWLPYDHVVPILTTHVRDVVLGLHQCQVPTAYVLEAPLRWLALLDQEGIHHTWSPNFGFSLVVDTLKSRVASVAADGQELLASSSLVHVKSMMNAGEQVTAAVVSEFVALLTPYGLSSNCVQPAFGMAESCTCISYNNVAYADRLAISAQGAARPFVSLGDVIPDVEIRITDEENHLLKEGQIGRMQIRGPVVTPGYLNNPGANAESFIGNGWFNSGDLGFIRDNQLVLTGREKESIIIRGSNFYCYEIEEALTAHENVTPTFVAGFSVQDNDTEALVVCYVPKEAHRYPADISTMNAIVSRAFGVEAVYILPVERPEFYKTTSGKIQRSQFKKQFEMGAFSKQCVAYDDLMDHENVVAYQPYQADWQSISIATLADDEKNSVAYGGHTVHCFDTSLYEYVASQCHVCEVVEGLEGLGSTTGSTALLFSLPFVLDFDGVLLLLDTLTQVVTDVSATLTTAVAEKTIVDIVLVGAIDDGLAKTQWAKPLLDTIAAENVSSPVQYRLRILSEHCISDTVFRDIQRVRCLSSLLLFTGSGQVYRPALRSSTLSFSEYGAVASGFFQGSFAVTGGIGGIGACVVTYLLAAGAKVLVIGRRSEEDTAVTRALTAWRDTGTHHRVAYQSLAQLDERGIALAMSRGLRELGVSSVQGIFHLAGTYEPRPLARMTLAHWRDNTAAKYQGSVALARYLETHTHDAPLVIFGSINSYFGAAHIAGYGVANALQNQVADVLNGSSGTRVYSINWSQWPGVGMASSFSDGDIQLAESKGFLPIQATKDLHWLPVIMHQAPGNYWMGLDHRHADIASHVVGQRVAYPWQVKAMLASGVDRASVEQWLLDSQYRGAVTMEPVEIATHVLSDTLPLSPTGAVQYSVLGEWGETSTEAGDGPRNDTDTLLFSLWQDLLGSRVRHIDQTFFECGGNSVIVTQLGYSLSLRLQRQLPVSSIFEYPTIRSYSDYLSQQGGPTSSDDESALSQQIATQTIAQQYDRLGEYHLTLLPPNNAGSENTIIYVPALIGLSCSYQHLLKQFDDCHQVLLGQDLLSPPSAIPSEYRVATVAKRYLALLREAGIELEGSVLVGWSFGGCIAYEMARQMSSYSMDVVMLDSAIQDAIPTMLADSAIALQLFAKDLGLAPSSLGNAVGGITAQVQSLQPALAALGMDIDDAQLLAWFEGYQHNVMALQAYDASDIPQASVHYLRAMRNPLGTPVMGWGARFEHFDTLALDSDHQQILYHPQLIERIRRCVIGE